MATVEVEIELSDVWNNASARDREEFVVTYTDELYVAMKNKSRFIKEHLEDADEDDIAEFLRSTGHYNVEEI